jgi:hypothetical protein
MFSAFRWLPEWWRLISFGRTLKGASTRRRPVLARASTRLRGWEWKGRGKKSASGRYVVHEGHRLRQRLPPHILDELERRNPGEGGRRRGAHHQWLTEDVRHPALAIPGRMAMIKETKFLRKRAEKAERIARATADEEAS